MKRFKDFLTEKVSRRIMFHGTSSAFLPKILSGGLKQGSERVWKDDPEANIHGGSRASLAGIYLTTNLMTSVSAAGNAVRKFPGNRIYVIVQFQPKSGVPDEDSIKFTINHAVDKATGSSVENQTATEYALAQFLFGSKDVQEYVKKFKDALIPQLEYGARSGSDDGEFKINPKGIRDDVLAEMLKNELIRRVVHQNNSDNKYYRFYRMKHWLEDPNTPEYPIIKDFTDNLPSVSEAERNALQSLDKMTRMLKPLVHSRDFLYSVRALEPIGFSGSNKILAVVEAIPSQTDKYISDLVVRYGTLPPEFIEQWKKNVGSGFKILSPKEVESTSSPGPEH